MPVTGRNGSGAASPSRLPASEAEEEAPVETPRPELRAEAHSGAGEAMHALDLEFRVLRQSEARSPTPIEASHGSDPAAGSARSRPSRRSRRLSGRPDRAAEHRCFHGTANCSSAVAASAVSPVTCARVVATAEPRAAEIALLRLGQDVVRPLPRERRLSDEVRARPGREQGLHAAEVEGHLGEVGRAPSPAELGLLLRGAEARRPWCSRTRRCSPRTGSRPQLVEDRPLPRRPEHAQRILAEAPGRPKGPRADLRLDDVEGGSESASAAAGG